MPGIIGKKLGMSQIIQDDGRVIPVTFVKCEPNTVVQLKTEEKDGYPAIVLGFDAYKNPSKNKKFKMVHEFRIEGAQDYKTGQTIDLSVFSGAKAVTVVSTSKGKGYQGVVRRHHFSGGCSTHGSHFKREPGSIGTRAKPGRVNKGHRMAGHMGLSRVTLKDRPIVSLIPEKALIAIKGPISGAHNGYVFISY
ncbi:MAG: 50S ribosomal protein L3 [Candidatus Peregrinibacteria bacterium]